jgi:hypothetical protein
LENKCQNPWNKVMQNTGYADHVPVPLPLAFQDASSSNEACQRTFHRHGGQYQRQNLVSNCAWLKSELIDPAMSMARERGSIAWKSGIGNPFNGSRNISCNNTAGVTINYEVKGMEEENTHNAE